MNEIINEFITHWREYAVFAGMLAGSVIIGILLYAVIMFTLKKVSARTKTKVDNILAKHLRGPLRLFFPVLLFYVVIPLSTVPAAFLTAVQDVLGVIVIICITWILLKAASVMEDVIRQKFDVGVKDNLHARKVQTQIRVLKRIVSIVIIIVSAAVILMRFDEVRQWGATILASAGIIGVVMGFAAQKTLSTLVAGFQIAFTQPIRIDDVVIVEGEWGHIEEITLTYVVLRIWDQRRLIIPITYFIDHTFQNWTRVSADILGTVFVYCDYTIPLESIRGRLQEICRASPLWDQRVCGLQVTDARERTVELRALVSAADSSRAWDLRCHVREELVAYIQKNFSGSLPKVRASLERETPAGHAKQAG